MESWAWPEGVVVAGSSFQCLLCAAPATFSILTGWEWALEGGPCPLLLSPVDIGMGGAGLSWG